MEQFSSIEDRRSKNLHTQAELESAGNRIIRASYSTGCLVAVRGRTYTRYVLVEGQYWKPIDAKYDR